MRLQLELVQQQRLTLTTFSGLSGSTDYDFYVSADCGGGDVSGFTGPFTFTTACAPLVAPWTEPFTGTTDPACWSQESIITGAPWVYTGNPGYDASGTADHAKWISEQLCLVDFSGTDAGVILTSPLIDVSALNVPELRFWIWSKLYGVVVLWLTYNLTHAEAFDGTTWQPLMTVQGEFRFQWTEFNVIIPATMIFQTNLVLSSI